MPSQIKPEDREIALESILGKMDNTVLHAPVPFHLGYDAGGRADVYVFHQHIPGVVYATGSLLGEVQEKSDAGNYELLIIQKADSEWAPRTISALAYYTLEASLNSGETMDIGDAAGANSTIRAFVFDKYRAFQFQGETAGLLLCIGITAPEVDFAKAKGGKALLQRIKDAGVYPYTIENRKPIL